MIPSALLPPAGTLAGNHTSRLPLRQIRRDRRRVRTTDNHGSVRLPSVRPELCSPGGLGSACCSRAQPRPAPCRLPRSLPASSKAGGPFQTIPGSRRCLAASPFTSGKMRLSDFCNRLYKTSTLRTVRFPVAPRITCFRKPARAPTHPGPKASRLRRLGTPNPLTGRATEWSFA